MPDIMQMTQELQQKLSSHFMDDIQKLQLQVDRLQLQLEQARTQLALVQEQKAETELQLKKEKKSLLEAFLSARDQNRVLIQLYQTGQSQSVKQILLQDSEYNNCSELGNYSNNFTDQKLSSSHKQKRILMKTE